MLSRDEVMERIKDKPWVSPFEKIVGIYSSKENLVQLYEYHARNSCYGAAAWAVYHYKQTSPLIINAKRDGARDIFTLKTGTSKLNLKPSFSSAGIEAVEVKDNKIYITYAGLAGGGVGSSLCRALANRVEGVIIHAEGGGDKLGKATIVIPDMCKLQVAMDDTDKAGEGATWSLANEIAYEISKEEGIEYLNHTLVQLYPGTPEKTTNCVATVLTFAIEQNLLTNFKKKLIQRLKELTLSDQTGLAFYDKIIPSHEMITFSERARTQVVTIEEAKQLAIKNGIDFVSVTGDRGLIGATAALGLAEQHERAVKPAVAEAEIGP
jgi:methanogenesis imperfect marker protein 11